MYPKVPNTPRVVPKTPTKKAPRTFLGNFFYLLDVQTQNHARKNDGDHGSEEEVVDRTLAGYDPHSAKNQRRQDHQADCTKIREPVDLFFQRISNQPRYENDKKNSFIYKLKIKSIIKIYLF